MEKTGPVPSGCGENPSILRCRPCAWNNQTLRTPPRLARFPLATPSTPVGLTGPSKHTAEIPRLTKERILREIAALEDANPFPARAFPFLSPASKHCGEAPNLRITGCQRNLLRIPPPVVGSTAPTPDTIRFYNQVQTERCSCSAILPEIWSRCT